ncbi:MAG: nickel pincer cofactor biosynthesis protein LarB [Cyclobacteriaceae bacterium]|nr:nickel pincer cofactor biosynthesis protein LarB [Cyclobacteriaceae bacterium]
MNHINLDFEREGRTGFPEVVYGKSKDIDSLLEILKQHQDKGLNALITKLQSEKARKLLEEYPDAFYDPISGAFMLTPVEEGLEKGDIGVVSAGTSDLFVVNEIFYTLAYLNIQAVRIGDVGVAGVHRLMDRLEDLKKFKVLIVVAGFEGALPTVMAGLLPQPVIAVPVSVGYGVAEGGHTALHSMLGSCSNGITVVNIDNGYGAAMAAFRILRLIETKN